MKMITTVQAANLLLAQDNILILCHRSPDGDTVGSAHALFYALKALGKSSAVQCADSLPKDLRQILGNVEYDSFVPSFIVAVDVADTKLLGTLEEKYGSCIDLCLDHHPSNRLFAEHVCLDGDAAATAEIVFDIIVAMGVELSAQIATCVYLALTTDTGCFKYQSTSAKTLETAAKVVAAGAPNGKINQLIFETKSKSRVALENHVLSDLRYYLDDHCAVIVVPLALLKKYDVTDEEMNGISGIPRQIEGVDVAVTIREQDNETCRISLRTTEAVNASEICAVFDGGGHARAAGCTIAGTIEQAEKLLVGEISKRYC